MTTPIKWGDEISFSPTGRENSAATITGLTSGRFVVTWTDHINFGPSEIRAQLFDSYGRMIAPVFQVNTVSFDKQGDSAVAALNDGGFVVTWYDHSQLAGDNDGSGIMGRIFDRNGVESGPDFLVNTTTEGYQINNAVATLPDGRFVVVWVGPDQILGQMFDADGQSVGDEFRINAQRTTGGLDLEVTALTNGGFAVSWTDYKDLGSRNELSIHARLFNSHGNKAGPEFQVNTTNAGNQTKSAITALANGRFVVSWEDFSATGGDTSDSAIRAQVFESDGTKSGPEFLVNTTTDKSQWFNEITALPDGRFVICWSDSSRTGADTSGSAIRAQVFNGDGSPMGSEFLVNTTTEGTQIFSTITALADGRFAVGWQSWLLNSAFQAYDERLNVQIFDARTEAIHLNGTFDDDDFVGTIYGDDMAGSLGDDRLAGGLGDDDLHGQDGSDLLRGQLGNDRLAGGNGNDRLKGGHGADQLAGQGGHDALYGGTGADYIRGGDGNDTLRGHADNDILRGGAGNDRLIGGKGQDSLTGGRGEDVFIFRSGNKIGLGADSDVICDFRPGFDRIDLRDVAPGQVFIDGAGFSMMAGEVRYVTATGAFEGDTDGDGVADFRLILNLKPQITTDDLIL